MPRSPSRDLSDRFTGKRGYFRRPDALRRGKNALAVVALLGAGAWAAVDVLRPSKAAYAHTHGPLANPHAAFDDNCAACHVPQGFAGLGPLGLFNARDRWHDLTCEKCHAGPAHHASANDAAKQFHDRCSNCHHDHNGRMNSLVKLADKDCNQCHASLDKFHDVGRSKAGTPYQNAITNFVKDHPEFRSLGVDPKSRTLKFSHAVHMSPGQAYSADGKEAMTVGKLRALAGEAAIARYAPGAADGVKVELACASCHALDAGAGSAEFDKLKGTLANGDPNRALLPPRAEGAYFLPVNFEAHCRSCHPLNANEGVAEAGGAKAVIPGFDLPHRRRSTEVLSELKAGYVKGMIASGHPALKQPPQLGGKLDPQPKEPPARTIDQEAERLAQTAAHTLLNGGAGCFKCHQMNGEASPPGIKPVPNRTVWLTHAKFNHASHRGATCATCHPGTGAAYLSPTEADKPEPVQILGLKTCQACHSPAGTKVTLPDGSQTTGGGVRHSCTDCHRYHNGDHPLQGRGAPARATDKPLDLSEWLKGNR